MDERDRVVQSNAQQVLKILRDSGYDVFATSFLGMYLKEELARALTMATGKTMPKSSSKARLAYALREYAEQQAQIQTRRQEEAPQDRAGRELVWGPDKTPSAGAPIGVQWKTRGLPDYLADAYAVSNAVWYGEVESWWYVDPARPPVDGRPGPPWDPAEYAKGLQGPPGSSADEIPREPTEENLDPAWRAGC